ncbi:MAG: hypothetical protein ACHQYP_00755 [Nitrospiria bacterium]
MKENKANKRFLRRLTSIFAFFLLAVWGVSGAHAAPQILSFRPASIGQGAQGKIIGVYGTGFQCGISASFSDPTIQALPPRNSLGNPVPYQCAYSTSPGTSYSSIYTNVQFVTTSSNTFTSSNVFMTLNTFNTTSAGTITVTLTNPPPPYGDGTSGTGTLVITPGPTITSVVTTPLTVFQGMTFTATISGGGFQSGSTLSFPNGGVTVNSFYVNGTGTSGVASLTLSSAISPAQSPMTLTNPDGGVTSIPSAFSVMPVLTDKTPAIAVYEDLRLVNGNQVPFESFWNGSWSGEGGLPPSLNLYVPTSISLSPHPFLLQQTMGHRLGYNNEFQIWNNGSWGNQVIVSSYYTASKNFDMSYEVSSGNGLAVYGVPQMSYTFGASPTTTGIAYRQIFQTGSTANCDPAVGVSSPCWGPETPMPVPLSQINSNPKYLYWIKLLSNPDRTKNEIMMAYEDNTGRLFVRSWNGGGCTPSPCWGPEVQVSSLLRTDSVPFDIAYMQSRQMGMLGWAEKLNGTPKACVWNGTACAPTSTPMQTGSSPTTSLFAVQMASDPASDQIILGTIQSTSSVNGTLKVQIWNGTSWPTSAYPADLNGVQLLSNTLYVGSQNQWNTFNLIWKNNPRNVIFAIYSYYNGISGGMNYQNWISGTGWSGNTFIPGIPVGFGGQVPYFVAISFDSDPRTGDILGVMRDFFGLLSAIRWDENSFSWTDFKQINSVSDPIPVDFSYFKNLPTLNASTLNFSTAPAQNSSPTVSISGTLIKDGAVLSFTGFTPSGSTTVTHGANGVDTLSVMGTIGGNTIPGSYDLTVTNPDGTFVVGTGLVTITAASVPNPTIYSVSPNNRGQGAINQTLTLSGYNLSLSTSYSISFMLAGTVDSNITILTPQPVSAVGSGQIQNLTIQVSISSTAANGLRGLLLTDTTTGISYPFQNLFTVNYGPSITGISPGTFIQGTTQPIAVTGNDFQQGAVLSIQNGASSFGWNNPGGTPSDLFKNQMTGSLIYISGPASGVVLDQIFVNPSQIDPSQTHGQIAIYDNDPVTNTPTIREAQSAVQTFTGGGGNTIFNFNLTSPPVILKAPAYYWVLLNVDGLQTIISKDENRSNCSVNGYSTICQAVTQPYPFGSFPATGAVGGPASSWTSLPGNRYAFQVIYQPIIGSTQPGANSDTSGADVNKMTGSNFLTFVNGINQITTFYAYTSSVDNTNKGGSLAIYDSSGPGNSPGNLVASANNNSLIPNNFNRFPINGFTGAGTFWVMANVNGSGTTLNYDSGPSISQSSAQGSQLFGTWPASGTTTTWAITPNQVYSLFGTTGFKILGNLIGANVDGPDSNQMTGSQFTTTTPSLINGISVYVDTVDPVNTMGSAAIYDSDPITKLPRNLMIFSSNIVLQAGTFNVMPIPVTNLAAGSYWILVNVNGPGTTLTYDDGITFNGSSVQGIKLNNLFSNPWPNPGGSGWNVINGRRYAVTVTPDISISSDFISANVESGVVTTDLFAFTGTRQVCVTNPDGGEGCVTQDANNQPYFQVLAKTVTQPALTAYGTTLSNFPAYRSWGGYAPWNAESYSPVSIGGAPPLWTVMKSYPHAYVNGNPQNADSRSSEKVLGTVISNFGNIPVLTFQVWNGTSWGSSVVQNTSNTFSRSFDIAYEANRGNALAVYGISGSPVPQYQVWNNLTGWSLSQAIGSTVNQTGNTVLWVRLEPNPNPASINEIILAYLSGDVTVDGSGNTNVNSNITLHTLVWNGLTFGNEQVFNFPAGNINLCGNCTPPIFSQPFDIAYEHSSGRALLVWGETSNSTPKYTIWDGTQWSPWSTANRSAGDFGTTLLYLKLAGDPNSNEIAMGTGTINGQFYIQLWNGSGWGNPGIRLNIASPGISFSGEWAQTAVISPPATAGSQQLSSLVSDSASVTFSGSEIDIVGQKNSNLGIFGVYLDGVFKNNFDQYYPVATDRMVLSSLTNLTNGTHTLTVVPSGSRNGNVPFPGGTNPAPTQPSTIYGSMFTSPKNASIMRLAVFLNTVDSSTPGFQIALFSDNGGTPGTLLAQGVETLAAATGTWDAVALASPVALTAGTPYWILVITNGIGTTFTYSAGTTATTSISSTQLVYSFPASFDPSTTWNSSPGTYFALYAGQTNTSLDYILLGQAPSISVDSFDVKNTQDAPAVISTNLLYYSSPAISGSPDPNAIGRNFDLAWEKDSQTLVTVFGSSTGINSCGAFSPTPFPYATRFRTLSLLQATGWSVDAIVPLSGFDLVPRWMQLTADTTSNDLFFGVAGQAVATSTPCPEGIEYYHQYLWHNGGWADKETLNSTLSGLLQPLSGNAGNGAVGYTESFMTAFNSDSVPPSPVTDLIVSAITSTSATLRFTPTGEDGMLGMAASYALAYSTVPILSDTDFSNATQQQVLPGQLVPAPTLTSTYAVSYTLLKLSSGTPYYFAVKSADKKGNFSLLSTENPSAVTPGAGGVGLLSPVVINNLAVVPSTLVNNSVQLTWTAPIISSSYTGSGAAYDLRWSSNPIVDNVTFNAANPVIALDGTGRNGLSPPHLAGTREFFNFLGLPSGTTYFAIKSCGPAAMNPLTFRCTGNSANISPLNTNSAAILSPAQCYPTLLNTPCVNNGAGSISGPPSAITDLVITVIGSNTMTLRWTVPANTAQYDIRYSTAPITLSNFASARQVYSIPGPTAAGLPQSFTATNILSNTVSGITYYFAIEAINSAGESLSNVVSATTKPVFDYSPPSSIADLSLVGNGIKNSSVLLTWTAPGDDGPIGTAMQYDIRYSEFQIVEDGAVSDSNRQIGFDQANQAPNSLAPGPAGTHESFIVTGLDSNTVYYFAIKAIDKASNYATISTCLNCPGHTALHAGYNIVSVPYRLSGVNDPTSVFGNDVSKPVTVFQWNNGSYSTPSSIEEGIGDFLFATGNNSILRASDSAGNLLGTAETGASVTVPLQPGWNMIGSPYLNPVYLKDTCIKQGNSTSVSFGNAVKNGWIGNSIYSFDGTQYLSGVYLDPLGINPPAILGPWNGYWLQTLANDTVYSLVYLNTPGACP